MGERGIDAQVAATAIALGGVGQVLGRLGYRMLVARVGVRARTVVILAGVAATTALLGASWLGGYASMFVVLGAVSAAAAVIGLASIPSTRSHHEEDLC